MDGPWLEGALTAAVGVLAYIWGHRRGEAVTHAMLLALRDEAPAGWLLAVARRWSVDEHRAVLTALEQDLEWRELQQPGIDGASAAASRPLV